MREQLEVEDDELTLARQGQAALARYRSERDVGSPVESAAPRRADKTKLVIGLASVAAAAGLALWLGLRGSDDDHDERVGAHEVEPPRKQAPEQRHWEPVDPTPPPAAPVDAVGRLSMLTSSVPIERLGARLEPGSSFASLFEPELWPSVERACVSWSEPT
ncbi:MAG TPA: hypothetical protein VM869_25960, partial [Enhygromyxa sp.]|nr:hypothetical protein [Enhygromyxa sp.]